MSLGGILLSALMAVAGAKEIAKVNLADQIDAGGAKLVLNGAGLRVKKKFGMNFDVYVAGLYLKAKNTNANEVIQSAEPKVLKLVFLRSLDKSTLREAWEEGYKKNCKTECDEKPLKAFNDLMVDVKDKSELIMDFSKDAVAIEVKGKETKSGKIEGEVFRRNLLA